VTAATTPTTDGPDADARHAPAQVSAWAAAIEAGVLAAAARREPDVAWRGDATDEELWALEEAGARAQQELVAANLGLVGAVLGPYARGGASVADLFQEGCLGLIAAVERFDHRRGVRFSTYATYWIRAGVGAATSRLASAVTVPVSRTDQLRVAHGVESELTQRLGRLPTVAEVAAAIGRDERWTGALLGQRGVRSLDELDERALHRLSATAQTDEGPSREPAAWARRLLAGLTAFDRRVLELRLGFGGRSPSSLAAVARELGVPVGRVRRAEARALEQLRGCCPREVARVAS
jgi:RNA polymerase sigma factor (sigma-70 family)